MQPNGEFKSKLDTACASFCVGSFHGQQFDLIAALTQAAYDEANFKYMIPNEQLRTHFLHAFFGIQVRAGDLQGEVFAIQGAEIGAVWTRRDSAFTLAGVVRMAIRTSPSKWRSTDLRRCMEVAVKLDQVHRQLIRSPHRYLLAIGIGKALVAPLLSQPQEHHLPYYIDTFNANHLSLWKRRGFRIAGGGTITRNGPDFWALLNGRQGS